MNDDALGSFFAERLALRSPGEGGSSISRMLGSSLESLETGARQLQEASEANRRRQLADLEQRLHDVDLADDVAGALEQFAERTSSLRGSGADARGLVTVELGTGYLAPKVRVAPELLEEATPEKVEAALTEAVSVAWRNIERAQLRALSEMETQHPLLEEVKRDAAERLRALDELCERRPSALGGATTERTTRKKPTGLAGIS